jgi:factor associated with neutral sphingomyelinase activation
MQSKDKTVSNPPHLYSTHYSTPGYVAYYLIRRIPEFIVRLQNGVFNPSDRIFRCLESAYYSSMNSAADFK